MAAPVVLTVVFNHETNTFSNTPTTLEDFRYRGLLTGQEIDTTYRGTGTEIGPPPLRVPVSGLPLLLPLVFALLPPVSIYCLQPARCPDRARRPLTCAPAPARRWLHLNRREARARAGPHGLCPSPAGAV